MTIFLLSIFYDTEIFRNEKCDFLGSILIRFLAMHNTAIVPDGTMAVLRHIVGFPKASAA